MDKAKKGNENKKDIGDIQVEISQETKKCSKGVSSVNEIDELKKQLQEKEKEANDTLNRLLRVRADFDNYQKRISKERREFEKFAGEELIRELLPVMDNLERAMNSSRGTGEVAPLVKGLEMTVQQFKGMLKDAGLIEIKSIGEVFDPSRHEAIKLITSHDTKDNTIVEEYEKGYSLHDKVIRPSKVAVAKNEV
ncbi:MAG: nucleotide exchange factor GrpE [Nitrospinae bacterium]|nr:nucleotide exchange factor GrpE [Nitrospinota bacterium]